MRLLPIILLIALPAAAQSSGIRTWCNPIDLDYKYNFEQLNEKISYRSAADPVFVLHKGEYYLFATISGGWWHSSDLIHWNYIVPDKWPMEDVCAPAAMSTGDELLLFQSTFEQRPIFSATDPRTGHLDFYNRWLPMMPGAIGPWDPDIFFDERSCRWFMYFGSSDTFPLYVIELDPAKRLAYKAGEVAQPVIALHPELHGWERFGQDHRDPRKPYTEGAHMTVHNGRYYLQYGAPGTEYNVYANGTYVADDPMGPFAYAPYNPVSYKPGGFMAGAGHGSTFRDKHGNWWNSGTPWLGINWTFERRMAMFPAGFDADGQMFSNTRFGDFPHYAPAGKWSDEDDLFTGWMLLSYRKPATVSSTLDPQFPAAHLTDENARTFWVSKQNQPGETITIDLGRLYDVRAFQVNYADYQNNIFSNGPEVYTQFRMYTSPDGRQWQPAGDLTHEKRDRPNAYVELPQPQRARYVRYEHVYVAGANLAISDIRVFGTGNGKTPATPRGLTAERDLDRRNAVLTWKPVAGAVGYNILWGIRPDKLYQTYQVFADAEPRLEIRALTVDQQYAFAIEAFDENGVSQVSEIVRVE